MFIYDYDDYKVLLRDLIRTFPKGGRGQARKLAESLGVNSVVVSQVLSGTRHFSIEHGLKVAKFFGLDEKSTEFFLLLLNQARAGTKELEDYYQVKLFRARHEALNLKNRVIEHRQLTDPEKGIFYSNWFYSGIRLLTSIEGFDNIDAIANYFGFSRLKTASVVQFLVSVGLLIERDGKIEFGPAATYVDAASPFVNSHRRNWRLKALERFSEIREGDMFYSSPASLSAKDVEHIRRELGKLIEAYSKRVSDSPAEKLYCLNVDWFQV